MSLITLWKGDAGADEEYMFEMFGPDYESKTIRLMQRLRKPNQYQSGFH